MNRVGWRRVGIGCLAAILWATGSVANAQTQPIAPPDAVIAALRQACTLTRASWICDAAQIAAMTKNLIESGPQRILQLGQDLAEGWVYDAMETTGTLICVDPAQPSTCLSNMLAESKSWLGTEPGLFLNSISERLRQLYLSNLRARLNPLNAPLNSPQMWAARAIELNPALKARTIAMVANDLSNRDACRRCREYPEGKRGR
jgi:hypothetical protein